MYNTKSGLDQNLILSARLDSAETFVCAVCACSNWGICNDTFESVLTGYFRLLGQHKPGEGGGTYLGCMDVSESVLTGYFWVFQTPGAT